MKWLMKRLAEPSTMAGLVLVLQGASQYLAGDKTLGVSTAAGGAAAIFLPEKAPEN